MHFFKTNSQVLDSAATRLHPATMSNPSVLTNNSTAGTSVPTISPQESALHSLCKHLLKSRLFRGFYEQRRYVEQVRTYRDIVSLQHTEKDLRKLLRDISQKLQMFYLSQNQRMWIGVTNSNAIGVSQYPGQTLDIYIWVELDELAFGQYWFTIKTVKFRENEVMLKLKMVRPVEFEIAEKHASFRRNLSQSVQLIDKFTVRTESQDPSLDPLQVSKPVEWKDFRSLFRQWGFAIRGSIYEFMAEDISKKNIKNLLRFLILLILSLLSGLLMTLKFIGIFIIRFMLEITRLTHVLTPIVLKIIDVFNKIIGGFFILLAMIWKDVVVNRGRQQPPNEFRYLQLNSVYKSLTYNTGERRQNPGNNVNRNE
ncbi:hypothetical protein GQX74_000804 [Glossina fuscipes]|nr:hypothetical protein GQX74_000804 [Glossina fuscipes]